MIMAAGRTCVAWYGRMCAGFADWREMSGVRRARSGVVAGAVVAALALVACSNHGGRRPSFVDGSAAPVSSVGPPLSVAVTPARGAKDVPISAEIGVTVTGGTISAVTLRDADGHLVAGTLRDDGSAWVPGRPLKSMQRYEASVTAVAPGGRSATAGTSFTTMAGAGRTTGTGLYLFDGQTYGVGMPVVAEFSPGIGRRDRAAVQKRMFVQTDPPQPGTWSWTPTGTQAFYRGPVYWRPGTTLTVRLALAGLPTGGGRYGDQDRSATARIGRSFVMTVENTTKQMMVVQDGRTIRALAVSLGKPSTPSSSGTMVIMDKQTSTIFDTRAELGPKLGYRIPIQYAQRLTWSGQFIHAASWSVDDQGRRNVSHGCVNLSPANARWLFDRTLIGDPITVRGTSDRLAYGNGWTAWDRTWTEFVKGSALPVATGPTGA
jgi:lipoprotein-anchoring transpeptidase ErfK/SrfK